MCMVAIFHLNRGERPLIDRRRYISIKPICPFVKLKKRVCDKVGAVFNSVTIEPSHCKDQKLAGCVKNVRKLFGVINLCKF